MFFGKLQVGAILDVKRIATMDRPADQASSGIGSTNRVGEEEVFANWAAYRAFWAGQVRIAYRFVALQMKTC